MDRKLPFSSLVVIGTMLFALFFGAGNLIFPAQLGQEAGTNFWPAVIGFLITGVGLPFLGILAIGFSGSANLQDLASRIHPLYAILFTSALYLTIGPFFAAPRTGAVAFDIGIAPFLNGADPMIPRLIFTALFFGITIWLSLNPQKIADRVGKILSPAIIILLLVLLVVALFSPMGSFQTPSSTYLSGAFGKGFTEGYNTMDALASLVFGIIVITIVRSMGVQSKKGIVAATFKTGIVAAGFLGILYVGIAYLGASSVSSLGVLDSGGAVLTSVATHYFGQAGLVLLGVVILLACLTTSIGLMTACGEYFHTLIPALSYKVIVTTFTVFCFIVSNIGLNNIITYSVPVLLFLYPLAITLMLLTFVSPLFGHARIVYVAVTIVAMLISVFDGLAALADTLPGGQLGKLIEPITAFYGKVLPLYENGLGWLIPTLIVIVVFGVIARVTGMNSKRSLSTEE
ncbi:branched-chain amino acid transport system II carrier protein [Sporosarcina aquimarina]|uniref:branched-chain amino acid transport system II carrier protein n=1 Tax=Sporosarcina aquimarina TaxID=114975 RepID=UPI00203C356F|nr:branched-chain amino acid transport system II carrier protein [Sporosarcina aquimarina]MCM3757541.1 branched-chain amino acid transport system II carrier protein [Sporosarcina aquimarina]